MSTAVPLPVGDSWPQPGAQQRPAAHRDRTEPGSRSMLTRIKPVRKVLFNEKNQL